MKIGHSKDTSDTLVPPVSAPALNEFGGRSGSAFRLKTLHRIISFLVVLLPICIAIIAFAREDGVSRVKETQAAINSIRMEVVALGAFANTLLSGDREENGEWSAVLDASQVRLDNLLAGDPLQTLDGTDAQMAIGRLRAELDDIRGLLRGVVLPSGSMTGFGISSAESTETTAAPISASSPASTISPGSPAPPVSTGTSRLLADRLSSMHVLLNGLDAKNSQRHLSIKSRLDTMILSLLAYAVFCAVLIAFVLPRYVFNRLEWLKQGLVQVAAGDLGPAAEIVRDDEIGALARTFNAMTASLIISRTSLMEEIGRRTQAEQDLVHRERQYRTLVDNIPDIVARFDTSLRCCYINPAAESVHGHPPEWYLGRAIHELGLSENATRRMETGLGRAFEQGEGSVLEFTDPASSSSVHYQVVITPEPSETGRTETVLAIVRNITSHRESEILRRLGEEQRTAREAAEAANRAKSDFLARMSHEIRTPMNGIMGMTELAMAETHSPEARTYMGMIRQSAVSLLSIINDILDLSKIEAGKMELEEVEFDLRDMLGTALRPLALIAGEKGVRLFSEVDRDVPRRVLGDHGRLRQVLVNLVGNAVKFTSRGHVSILVAANPMLGNAPCDQCVRSEDRVRLLFSVRDTGSGIPADKLGGVFDSFSQGPFRPGSEERLEGTGLGLAIVRQLVEMMGGEIKAESVEGKGSTFSFSVEFRVSECSESGTVETTEFEPGTLASGSLTEAGTVLAGVPVRLEARGPLRILLVEDDAINQLLASELLAKRGHSVSVAKSGREALEALAGQWFDLVLMDVRMPEMNGEEATRLIRSGELPGIDPGVPIVALTAHALKGDRERFLAAGMDDYLSKPIELDCLDRVLDRLSDTPRPGTD